MLRKRSRVCVLIMQARNRNESYMRDVFSEEAVYLSVETHFNSEENIIKKKKMKAQKCF